MHKNFYFAILLFVYSNVFNVLASSDEDIYSIPSEYGSPFAGIVYSDDFQIDILPFWYYYWLTTNPPSQINIFCSLENISTLSFFVENKAEVGIDSCVKEDITFAISKSAQITNNKVDTLLGSIAVTRNTYIISFANGNKMFYDNFFLRKNGKTFRVGYSLNYSKYAVAYNFAMLYLSTSIHFYETTNSGNSSFKKKSTVPNLSYYSTFNGDVFFRLGSNAENVYIYDLTGKLVREIKSSCKWDGKDALGHPVKTGFYVSNIKTNTGLYALKFFKR